MTPDSALVDRIAQTYDLPATRLMAQIQIESAWDPNAFRFELGFFSRYVLDNLKALGRSYGPLAACSFGLLQIMLEVALEIGFTGRPESLFDPETGLQWGAKKLRAIWDAHPAAPYPQVLAIYNGGESGNLMPPYRNQGYVDKILSVKV